MSELTLSKTSFRNGVWTGLISGAGREAPEISVTHDDVAVHSVALDHQDNGDWQIAITVPTEAIADGVHTFLILDAATQEKLADFTFIAGEALQEDLRAEVELLRAELDMLKRAFRRHCLET